ncbi:MAG: hypothetical protein A2626_00910 [Candidatus Nealsonbacteria bacterium RIFCSPHIGHO2_01_FULL_38_55]|uniref:SHSP domain-containing protein n=1 Tax=Candidatus Nealsonbacteria bacterium RIFCSPHIGHO2_01_FULL_38_55 TaxID=1801664 RepID=A0A1G2E3U9_9BACT|nr:MAG: hypothetical protein A2626_00910 [Candidatus Nealsonbacteria bacterium RIFCSPHIGHO2_01_FULL_38_55]OGZ21750.1 MAG: hypothetical protein A2W55_00465 [Candidatus Nealsonbacteria bacterium RIFCSPHIGHO2_02_38_10]OGZ25396.1 MAG: hypothetical protein A3I85_01555 [Candidatus Nealsonbacteria bacterium RIFCSPLOWO2_02_FULL_38_63]
MANFLEKLKKGMEINELPKEAMPEEIKREEINPKETEKPKTVSRKKKKEEPRSIREEKLIENIAEENPKPKIKPSEGKIEIKTEKFETSKKEPAEENNWLEEEGQLAIDVYQTEKEIVVQSAIAGVKPEDLDILVENDIVLIRGSRPKPMEKENQNYFYQECHWGRFCREIVLPEEVNNLQIKAGLSQGILTIRLPKTGRKEKKKLLVEES